MDNDRIDFKKAFRFEASLVVLFLATFVLYFSKLLPHELEEAVFIIVGLAGVIPVAKSALESLFEKRINVDLLAAIALFFSFISEEWGSMLFINLMLTGARMLDLYTKRRVRLSLESLMKLKPVKARVLREGKPIEIPLSEVRIGDLVIVNLGEQIPVDGVVFDGSATINQASLTGESFPVLKEVNSSVLAATVVVSGNIIIRTEHIGTATTFERMIKLVEASHQAKTRMKTLAERFASWYIGIMLLVAVILFLVTNDTRLVLAVVLVVCADDIAIAVPLAYIVAIGTAARHGIVIKSADFLEQASKLTTLIVDKTGTLTLGKLAVATIHRFNNYDESTLLKTASALCARSNHPVSVAIREHAKEKGFTEEALQQFKEIEGRGLVGKNKNGEQIMLGRLEFLDENGIGVDSEVGNILTDGILKGNNMTLLAINDRIVGIFALEDEVRSGMQNTIQTLKNRGIKEIIMLTGDNEGTAKNIAAKLGIDKYYSKLMPEHKVFVLKDHLGKNNRIVGMVGDGVNDAAVLAQADVGIAMGRIGTDAAIESADIVLMQDDFGKILEVREISEKVRNIVRGNFLIWGVVNAIGLYFVFIHVFGPSQAALYNFLTDFIPIANSLRMFQSKKLV
ncbi:MAG: cation-translocating P-type ATPase [Candidatus Pacebacteria bacterium]|jgi:heavy metal translocating P-type ATPase|nr:cation-translocating P-type ATPase [Candidatus Paceibacterota bacterium]